MGSAIGATVSLTAVETSRLAASHGGAPVSPMPGIGVGFTILRGLDSLIPTETDFVVRTAGSTAVSKLLVILGGFYKYKHEKMFEPASCSSMDSDLDDFEVIDLPRALAPTIPIVKQAQPDAPAKPPHHPAPTDPKFRVLGSVLQETANARNNGPIFHAKLDLQDQSLFKRYLSSLNENLRAEHNCSSCRYFLSHFGDLCQVQDDGTLRPLIWPLTPNHRVPSIYRKFVREMTEMFDGKDVGREYRITSTHQLSLGQEATQSSPFQHFHVRLAENGPLANPLGTLSTETSYRMLVRVLDDYDMTVISEAHHLLHHKLLHSTSHRPAIIWLKRTAEALQNFDGNEVQKRNLVTRYASGAQLGFLPALRGGLVGTLLTDIDCGLEFEDISRKWNNLANGLAYMRPTALPSAGNVQVAKKSFEALGYTRDDLMRYFMTIDQIPDVAVLWKDHSLWSKIVPSRGAEEAENRTFASLDSKLANSVASSSSPAPFKDDQGPPTKVSFRTFVRKTLPDAESIELEIASARVLSFFTIGAPSSKSPFYFGSETNSASWYRWGGARNVANIGLNAGYCKVTAITTFPHMWEYMTAQEAMEYEDPSDDVGAGTSGETKRRWIGAKDDIRFMFCIQGARSDTGTPGLSLFPSLMRGEFHGYLVRIENLALHLGTGVPEIFISCHTQIKITGSDTGDP
ncbi:hypothetical protein EST38_g5896 [Candolleomyces aberdarensis]|uniref:Uncharacterized protein n=1 Tax=Candolleomyces aberdarensis TaxID=2316362 RepID=A0A4Q2DML2_9AGAR|nr:hypothetical protein EST38_g5896 [Candolleomyces aberdarensis]